MAYNYNPYQYQGFPQVPQQYQYQGVQIGQPQQVQQSAGFISVRGIEEAYNFPIAPGNSLTFKDELAPYIYTKTKGFSQLDAPVFEKYRLVKEENAQPDEHRQPENAPETDKQIKLLWDEINALKAQLEAQKPKRKLPGKKGDEENAGDTE